MVAGYFIIAILGCADGYTQCTPVMTVPTHYESEAACEAATTQALLANTEFDFPSLLARCRPETPRSSADRRSSGDKNAQTGRG